MYHGVYALYELASTCIETEVGTAECGFYSGSRRMWNVNFGRKAEVRKCAAHNSHMPHRPSFGPGT
jgi:hypothetical protein